MKNRIGIIFVGLILILLSVSSVSATCNSAAIWEQHYNFDGDGSASYPNNGVVTQYAYAQSSVGVSDCIETDTLHYDSGGNTMYVYTVGHGQAHYGCSYQPEIWFQSYRNGLDIYDGCNGCYIGADVSKGGSEKVSTTSNPIDITTYAKINRNNGCGEYSSAWTTSYISTSPINNYTISGEVSCIISVDIYIKVGETYILENSSSSTSYIFNIVEGYTYKLVFSNGYEYEFTCNGDITYNYDGCGYTTINIYDNCANLLYNQFTWIDDDGNIVYSGYDNPIVLPSSKVNENDKLIIMWTTWLGALQKTCFAQFDHPINLYDPFLYWDMEVYVYDNESNPLYHANVDFNQDCVINGYPTRNKFTDSDGMASFTQCENDNANLIVSKNGYKTLSTSISGGWYDAYTPTYQVSVILQSSDSDNSSTWDLINDSINDTNATEIPTDIPDANGTPNDIQLYFRNTDRYRITEVNDTDDYVRCYYSVWCDDPVSMTLKFQESSNGYDWSDVYTYGQYPDNDSYGYMNISNSYFNDSTLMYRAYIYDLSYPYNDRYAYLNVINVTNESETHYENLTGYCMFMNTNKNGSIDYREDITCYTMVISDNASLRTVSLELYDNSTLIDYKNLTNSSFDDDIYGWYLGYNYILGHNYSLVLRGYDGSILDCDNVIAYNLIGNKLTIKVTDSFNHDLSNVYVFCEHYGSINTGWLSYGTFEGLPDGETRYKASKSGYRSGIWSTVNLTSENEIVTYQLIQEKQEGSITQARMSDDDVKDLYYPFMYFLFIIILIGALMNVIK